jgi:hypothetical protein
LGHVIAMIFPFDLIEKRIPSNQLGVKLK